MLLRASTNNMLNDVERAIDDGVNTFQAMARDGRFVAGAGAVDIELAKQLAEYGQTVTGLEQYAVKAFGKAFETVPHTLADNAGYNAIESISKMYAAHNGPTGRRMGLNVDSGEVVNAVEAGISFSLVCTCCPPRLDLVACPHV